MELLLVLIIVVLVIWLIVLSSRLSELKNENTQKTETIERLTSFVKNDVVSTREECPTKDTIFTEDDDYYTDTEIYEKESKKAIKMFIDDLYIRKYEKDEKGEEKGEEKGADFERFIGAVYRLAGYDEVIQNGIISSEKGESDGGKDVIAIKDGKTTVIQCKHYARTKKVGTESIRALYGIDLPEVDEKVFVTTGRITSKVSSQFVEREEKVLIINQQNLYNYLCLLIPEVLKELEITKESFKVDQRKTCQKCERKDGILILNNAGNANKSVHKYKCQSCKEETIEKRGKLQ